MSLAEDLQTEPRRQIGGNNPPPLSEILKEKYAAKAGEIDALAARANEAPREIKDEADLHTIGDLVRAAKTLSRALDSSREDEKAPHLAAGREVDGFFKAHTERLNRIAATLGARADDYQRRIAAEERRRREEEAQRQAAEAERQRRIAEEEAARNRPTSAIKHQAKAAEAEAKAAEADASAQASAADLTRTRSAGGTVVSARTEWDFEILDIGKVDLEKLRPFLKREHVDQAIRTFMRMGNRELGGVRFFENVKANFR